MFFEWRRWELEERGCSQHWCFHRAIWAIGCHLGFDLCYESLAAWLFTFEANICFCLGRAIYACASLEHGSPNLICFLFLCVWGNIHLCWDIHIYIYTYWFFSFILGGRVKLLRHWCGKNVISCPFTVEVSYIWKPTIPHIQVSTLPAINIAPENRPSQKEFHLPTIHFKGIPVCFGERYAGCCTYNTTFVFLSLFHQKKRPPQILQTIRPGCLMFGFRTEVCFWIGRFSQKSPRETLPTCDQTPDSGSLHFCIRDWTGWPLTLRDFVAWRFLIRPVYIPHSFLDPRFGTSSLLARDLAGWRAAERFSLGRHHMCLLLPKSCGWAWHHNSVWQSGIVQMHPTVAGWWFQIFYFFTPTCKDHPIWLIFFKWVGSTTN